MLDYLFFTFISIVSYKINKNIFSFINRTFDLSLKQRAYILSTFTSCLLFICSAYINYHFWKSQNLSTFITSVKSSTFLVCLQLFIPSWFTGYLIADCKLGRLYYSKYMESLSGYIHHFIYLCFNVYSLLGNLTIHYSLFFVLEFPTFILGLGSVNPQLRSNALFGCSFFITRICYHAYLMIVFFTSETVVSLLAGTALCIHFYWFICWWERYVCQIF